MTIVVDASALLAILLIEQDADDYLAKLAGSTHVLISPVNLWEVQVRMYRGFGAEGMTTVQELMSDVEVVVEPVTQRHSDLALQAFARYRGRPARLNMGDCFAYALARAKNAPLLYKGSDFSHTDLQSA